MSNSLTPLWDFVKNYAQNDSIRLHMPGHKGKNILGFEKWDLTEIPGADSLYEACGIIAQSEKNLSDIFGTKASFYSTEGSSLCIKAMLYLALKQFSYTGRKKIIAARNVHKSFIYASVLLDFDTIWLGKESDLYSAAFDTECLSELLSKNSDEVAAVYITSPDYLGNIMDIKSISQVCHNFKVPLIVDNAHGAYLKFFTPSLHPMDLGADMCCDSAHKTLPVLTGGAYLHVSKNSVYSFDKGAKNALALFGSTSPSYLIMCSMDIANGIMTENFSSELTTICEKVRELKASLTSKGFELKSDEPLKLTVKAKSYGYYGHELSAILQDKGIFCEASDRDNLVMMFSPYNEENDFSAIEKAFSEIPKKEAITEKPAKITLPSPSMTVKEAMMCQSEIIPVSKGSGRTLASVCVSCPPAIPIAICGEKITDDSIKAFLYYGTDKIEVII